MGRVSPEFLGLWNTYGQYLSYALFAFGIAILLVHILRLMLTRDFKSKYDYINLNEINLLWYSSMLLIVGGTIYSNTLVDSTGLIWFLLRIGISVMLGIIATIVIQNVLKFYYPFFIEKRLKFLRYTPRVSPDGKKMKLLSEEEEDVYLDEGMQAEEDAFSVDYDVWIDESSGYTKIEKYNGRLHALKCPECSYQTLKVNREEVMQVPTATEEGELIKYYACTYCEYKERKSFRIAKTKKSEHA